MPSDTQPANCRTCQHLVIERGVCPQIATCEKTLGLLGCERCGKWSELVAWRWAGVRGQVKCPRCDHHQSLPLRDDWRVGCCATNVAAEVIVPFQGRTECEWYEPLVLVADDAQRRLF